MDTLENYDGVDIYWLFGFLLQKIMTASITYPSTLHITVADKYYILYCDFLIGPGQKLNSRFFKTFFTTEKNQLNVFNGAIEF